MSEPRIGRVLVASLHQGIAETLPDRLEFYENWLSVEGLREGTIGLAPLHAVLSFLRTEGEAYHEATARAGRYAAEWTVTALPAVERRLVLMLPAALRVRAALRTARGLVHATYPGSRAIVHVRKGQASVDLRGSLFCEVREPSAAPLCGFYAAAIRRVLELFALGATATVVECRSSGARRGCTMAVAVAPEGTLPPAGSGESQP
jgi:hypothetical protein